MTTFKQETAKQNTRMNPDFIQIGIVKDNRDPHNDGRLKVWLEGSSSAEATKSGWVTCNYCSPFAGRTQGSTNADAYAEYPKSYGFWAVPPDIGSKVFVFFINGRIEKAYWFGGSFDYNMNHQVPGPQTSVVATSALNTPYPVIDYDRNTNAADPNNLYVDVPLTDGLQLQNLLYDIEKGVPNRSARRQSPSTVYGMSTPRGNHFVMDDGFIGEELNAPTWDDDQDAYQNTEYGNPVNDTNKGDRKNEGIVLRTRSGAQLLISESEGNIFIINRDGTARIEMDADGNVTVLGDKDISIRAKQDINYFAERDINIESLRDVNIKVGRNYKTEVMTNTHNLHHGEVVTDIDKNFRLYSKETMRVKTDQTFSLYATEELKVESAADISLKAIAIKLVASDGKLTLKTDVSVSNNVLVGADVKTGSVSLNEHIHDHIDHQGNTITCEPGKEGGAGQNSLDVDLVDPADDVLVEAFVPVKYEDVVDVNPDPAIAKNVAADIGIRPDKSLSALCFVMPVSGSVTSDGYWGTDITKNDGTVQDGTGWTINGKGVVVSIGPGYVRDRSSRHVVVDHKNGFISIYRNIQVYNSVQVNQPSSRGIDINTSLGEANGLFLFEIRKVGSALYGFAGSVDPGLFYIEKTGVKAAASNTSLTVSVATNPLSETTSNSAEQNTEVVKTIDIESIVSSMPLSGSLRTPPDKAVKKPVTQNTNTSNVKLNNEPIIQKSSEPEPFNWEVNDSDADIMQELKDDEGSKIYQAQTRTFRDEKFYIYKDSLGYDTIGYGHRVLNTEDFTTGITEEEATDLLRKDLSKAMTGSKSVAESYGLRLPRTAQVVLTEMVFQLGRTQTMQFTSMLKALADQDYEKAADEMRNSSWYKQTPYRVEKHAKKIQSL